MKARSWLMVSLIGMMSLVGCPSPADVDNSSDKTTEEENSSSSRTGFCEELLEFHLDFNPEGGTNIITVEPLFPGVPNPEKVTRIDQVNNDSNERFDNNFIKVLIFDQDLTEGQEFIVCETDFGVEWILEESISRPFLFKLCYNEPTGLPNGRSEQGLNVKIYLKYRWSILG
jgi:hypothetical protein